MKTDHDFEALEVVWRQARAIGALGSASVSELLEHAAGYIPAAFRPDAPLRAADVGSGVGVPGILLAALLPHSIWTLIDANERRCALARQASLALGIVDRVSVIHGRVDDLAHDLEYRESYELVVSRLFSAPAETAECCIPLVAIGGSMVVSCSTDGLEAWRSGQMRSLGGKFAECWELRAGTYARILKTSESDAMLPRRQAGRSRAPLF